MTVHSDAATSSEGIGAWIAAHGARIDPAALTPVSSTDEARLEALFAAFDDARIVVLGELNHWIAEKSASRLWWLRRLSARHRLVVGEEVGHSDGRRIARYLATGDETWLDPVPTFGWEGDRRADRDEKPTGVLRALAPRAFHGLDVNGVAGAGYADIRERLPALAPALASHIERGLTRVPAESISAEADRLASLRETLGSQSGSPVLDTIVTDLTVMEESFRYQLLANPAPTYEALRPAMAFREGMMKRAADRILDRMHDDEKLVLMAHALHLAKDDDRIGGSPGVGPGGNVVHSLGHYLARERGEAVCAVWFVFGEGSDCQPFPDLPNTFQYPPDSLNARLLQTGQPLVVATAPAANGALRTPIRIGHLYNLVVPIDLCAQADAVFFLPRVKPLPEV